MAKLGENVFESLQELIDLSTDKARTFTLIKDLYSLSSFNSKVKSGQVKMFVMTQLDKDAKRLIEIVARHMQVPTTKILYKGRKKEIVMVRFVVYHYLHRNLEYPSTLIKEFFNLESHTTVLNGITQVDNLIETDKTFKANFEVIQQALIESESRRFEKIPISRLKYNLTDD